MDATGASDPIYDDLARVWPRIEAVKFTNQKKVELGVANEATRARVHDILAAQHARLNVAVQAGWFF